MLGVNKILILGSGGGERIWYTEGNDARNFMGNWNYSSEIYNMTNLGPYGDSWVHGWGGSPRTYELTLNGIPSHSQIDIPLSITSLTLGIMNIMKSE